MNNTLPMNDDEMYEAKKLVVRLGECTTSYYLVLLIREVERLREELKEKKDEI